MNNNSDIRKSIEKISDYKWLIPRKEDMYVPGILYATEKLLNQALSDNALQQVMNVAKLKGILNYSLAMPDIHWGYGAPIGGVGAFDADSGFIVPGFVGYDINCGVRLLRSNLEVKEVKNKLEDLLNMLFINIPSGVGSSGKLKLQKKEMDRVLTEGAQWAVKNGYGTENDIESIEENGKIEQADPSVISQRSRERGRTQLGTLGSGNHFLEIQRVTDVYDKKTAGSFGIFEGQLTVMLHTGSRGFGHQICNDYLDMFSKSAAKHQLKFPDRQLVYAPVGSYEGKRYFSAMKTAVNYAFANRQIITHWVRETFSHVLMTPYENLQLSTVYDVAHNICKLETHTINNTPKKLLVHRKGATRAFPPGHPDLPDRYKSTGQPVLIPGTMGTASYVLLGTQKAMEETWGSTCHGAGRTMSRKQAVKTTGNRYIDSELASKGILAKTATRSGLAEEKPEAYKDIDEVIRAVEGAGLSIKIARMVPVAVMKG
jgi:tRNA-splicing ligase RtcB (3'-phosphate/5'-hydroxy nucleic acid ligase)